MQVSEDLFGTVADLLGLLRALPDACSEHDVFTDAFMRPADPVRYREILSGIGECTARIRESGCSQDEIGALVNRALDAGDPGDILVDRTFLVSLAGVSFSGIQQGIVDDAARIFAEAAGPEDPGDLRTLLVHAVRPATLADLLSAEVTGMERFTLITLLQGMRAGPGDLHVPGTSGDLAVIATEDPGGFAGAVFAGLFGLLAEKRIIPGPVFSGMFRVALGDIGRCQYSDGTGIPGDPIAADLVSEGAALARDGPPDDVRPIFGKVLLVAGRHGADTGISPEQAASMAGHVLSGYLMAGFSGDDRGEESPVGTAIRLHAQLASGSRAGAIPTPAKNAALGALVREVEGIVRVVTGDYSWRGIPLPDGSLPDNPFVLDGNHRLIRYAPLDLLHLSPESVKALAMEALYEHTLGPRPGYPAGDGPGAGYQRLFRAVSVPVAAVRGVRAHPGVSRWFDRLREEEYGPVNMLIRGAGAPGTPPDTRFIEAALAEARTGRPFGTPGNPRVSVALERTREARMEILREDIADEARIRLVTDRVWPEYAKLVRREDPGGERPAGTLAAPGRRSGPALEPGDGIPRKGTAVPGPFQPAEGTNVVPMTGPGESAGDGDACAAPGGRMPGGAGSLPGSPDDDGARSLPGSPGTGIRDEDRAALADAVAGLVRACQESREIISSARNGEGAGPGGVGPGGSVSGPGGLQDAVSRISDLSREIGRNARMLGEIIGKSPQHDGAGSRTEAPGTSSGIGRGKGENWEDLLRVSREISRLAGRLEEDLGSRKPGTGGPGSPSSISRRLGLAESILRQIIESGTEFRCILCPDEVPERGPRCRIPVPEDDSATDRAGGRNRTGRLEPSFAPPAEVKMQEMWEGLSYFDASYGDDTEGEASGGGSGRSPRESADRRYEQGLQALSREAERYLGAVKQRSRTEWETLDEQAEQIRQLAILEANAIRQEDFLLYQRFYQPVAGLVGVARKNIQQVLQRDRLTREMTELVTGAEIDEENLAAVRTTMRIFKESGKQPDRTRWCLSLLIDASSSMHDETVAKKLEATIRTAILFGEALNRVPGIRFEITAFADTEYIPLKRYQDGWNLRQGCYLIRQVIQCSGGTNDVGAIISAIDRMHRSRPGSGENGLIFVVSDGQSGVGGREQMRSVQVQNRDIRIFGWGIGPDMEKIEETYRPNGIWVGDIRDLPGSVGDVLRRELSRRPAIYDSDVPGTGDSTGEGMKGESAEGPCTN